jgi:CRISPR system Cascade subunit CasB
MTDSKPERFISHLQELQKDRGAMAALRRILASEPGQPVDARAYRYVEPYVEDESEWQRAMYYLVAGLFALHPQQGEQTLAEALSDLWRQDQQRDQQRSSTETRFLALLDSDPDQLPDRLRRVVAYLRSKNKGLDYQRLLIDLLQWRRPDRRVQQRWARQFYRISQQPTENEAPREVEA